MYICVYPYFIFLYFSLHLWIFFFSGHSKDATMHTITSKIQITGILNVKLNIKCCCCIPLVKMCADILIIIFIWLPLSLILTALASSDFCSLFHACDLVWTPSPRPQKTVMGITRELVFANRRPWSGQLIAPPALASGHRRFYQETLRGPILAPVSMGVTLGPNEFKQK